MLGPLRIAGCGVEVDVTLPSGVSTNEVQNRRRKLAENLTRHEHEVFITIPAAARTVRLWVADPGALDEPIGPSPLTTDDTLTADYAGTAFPPLIVLVDEAQIAFMCPAKDEDKRPYGGSKATSRYFMAARKIHNQGRAVNVLLWQGTQDPTGQNLPRSRPSPVPR